MARKRDRLGIAEIIEREATPTHRVIFRGIAQKPETPLEVRTMQYMGMNPLNHVTIVEREDPTHPFKQHQLDYPNEHELTGNREKLSKDLKSDYGWDDWK